MKRNEEVRASTKVTHKRSDSLRAIACRSLALAPLLLDLLRHLLIQLLLHGLLLPLLLLLLPLLLLLLLLVLLVLLVVVAESSRAKVEARDTDLLILSALE
jgi:hypothetical protein